MSSLPHPYLSPSVNEIKPGKIRASVVDDPGIRRYREARLVYGQRGSRMDRISDTVARNSLAKTMERVRNAHAPVAITRKGEGAVVMISMEDDQALEEAACLLRSPKNMRRLVEAMTELEEGKEKELISTARFSWLNSAPTTDT